MNQDRIKGGYRKLRHTFWVPISIQISLKVSAIRGPGATLLLRARTEGVVGTQEKCTLWGIVLHSRAERMVDRWKDVIEQDIFIFPPNRIPI